MTRPRVIQRLGGGALPLVVTTVVALALLILALMAWRGALSSDMGSEPVIVYCAAGVMPAVRPVAEQYEEEFGVRIELRWGSSGTLEAQIRASKGLRSGDLYIPAATDPFVDRNRIGSVAADETGREPFLAEVIPLAKFRLVLAVSPKSDKTIRSFDDLWGEDAKDVTFLIGNEQTAIGKRTKQVLEAIGKWKHVRGSENAVEQDTVTQITDSLLVGTNADAGFIWNANARQQGLEIVEIPELSAEPSTISAGVIKTSSNPTGALRFARYLAAPDKGQKVFKELHYETVEGDPWAVTPEVVLFSGGLNQKAIAETLRKFKRREGCKITTAFNGCGVLVTMMTKEGRIPDAYFACDVTFLEKVQDQFGEGVNVTNTDMVMLVRKGNPKQITSLDDLGKKDIAVGLAHEEHSALGALTADLLKERGLYDRVIQNRIAESSTAPDLVAQLTNSNRLDAVIVYRANCNEIGNAAEIIPINDKKAIAVQPFAIHHQAQYPQLTERLLDAIRSAQSRARFEEFNFRWQLGGPQE